MCESMVYFGYGNRGVLCNESKRVCASARVTDSPNLMQKLKKNMAPLGCAKALLRYC